MPKTITSWSYSRYSDWRLCPLKAKFKHVDRIKEPGNAAMQRGADLHTDCEKYIKGTVAKLNPALNLLKDELSMLRKAFKKKLLPVQCESDWAMRKDWSETTWDDWVNCWVRIKVDAAHYVDDNSMMVTDWKTGKYSKYKVAEYQEQLELYALAALLLHPHLERVQVRIGWIDEGLLVPPTDVKGQEIIYTQKDVARLRKEWEKRVKPMLADTKFKATPNKLCGWCWYGQAKVAEGGPGLCKEG